MKKVVKKSPKQTSNILPLGDRVLLKPIEEKQMKTESGIYLPEGMREDKGGKYGEVVAVGPGRFDDGEIVPMQVAVGQKVLYSWGDTIKHRDEEFVLVREGEILAVIK